MTVDAATLDRPPVVTASSDTAPARNGDRPVVVVGVDGSESSKAALRWAARHATAAGCRLRVVTVWEFPVAFGFPPVCPDCANLPTDADATVHAAVAEALGPAAGLVDAIEVVEGRPAAVLVARSRDADLLVVASHGHGALTGMLLGSVSQYCVQHAHCPVLVVRDQQERAA